MMGLLSLVAGSPGPNGFGLAPVAKEVTEGIDASNLTTIVIGTTTFFLIFYYNSIKLL
jgi:retinol dehydrogenase-12